MPKAVDHTFNKDNLSGYIIITKSSHANNRFKNVHSPSDFFSSDISIQIDELEGRIEFNHIGITYTGKRYKFHHGKRRGYCGLLPCDIPLGKYEFDKDETNEDTVVIYYGKN